jgi:hypothetical protein
MRHADYATSCFTAKDNKLVRWGDRKIERIDAIPTGHEESLASVWD